MRVALWMSPDPITVNPSTTVREARRLMRYYGIRHLPVVLRGRVVGVISDRDVRVDDSRLSQLASTEEVPHLLGSGELVETAMSTPAHTITDDASVEDAARLMLSRRISALPVLDVGGELVGMITTTDCLLAAMTPRPVADSESAR